MGVKRIAIIAGEASGDILGAGLVVALKDRYPDAEFYGIGGDLMIRKGFRSLVAMEQLSVMGLVEVLGRLRSLMALRKRLIADFIANPPDVFIGIDAPDFNLNIELALKAVGIPTVHYVSPSVWAWKKKRIYKIKQAVDLLFCLFPFEAKHYQKTQQKLAFVGHPLASEIDLDINTQAAKQALGYEAEQLLVAILPGSRSSETKYLASTFLQTALLLHQKYPEIKFLLPAANETRHGELLDLLEQFPDLPIELYLKQSREVMAASDAILIASGTATLEALLLKKSMVVAYKMSPLTYAIYSRMIRSRFVSLPNILANEEVVPEVLQKQATAENLLRELELALFDSKQRERQHQLFSDIHQQLRMPSNEVAADAIETLINDRQITQ